MECNPSMCNLMINPAFYFKISYLYFFEIIIIMAVSGIVDESSCCFLHSCEIKTLNHNRYLANKIRFSTYIIVQQRMKKKNNMQFSKDQKNGIFVKYQYQVVSCRRSSLLFWGHFLLLNLKHSLSRYNTKYSYNVSYLLDVLSYHTFSFVDQILINLIIIFVLYY